MEARGVYVCVHMHRDACLMWQICGDVDTQIHNVFRLTQFAEAVNRLLVAFVQGHVLRIVPFVCYIHTFYA